MPLSDAERRQRLSEAAKARWAAKKAAEAASQNKNPETIEQAVIEHVSDEAAQSLLSKGVGAFYVADENTDPMSGPQPGQVTETSNPDQGDIARMVEELVAQKLAQMGVSQTTAPVNPFQGQTAPQTPQFGAQGLVGTYEKYLVNPKLYPDPRERLSNEAKLQRFAFKQNYELEWEVGVSQYQTKDNLNIREPKFTLKLRRIMFDEETQEPTNQRYVVCQLIFHEDPQAALVIAAEQGYPVDEQNEADFLNEMRYLRMRDWLLEAFYPRKPQTQKDRKEMVIGNRLVEVFTINSEQSQAMPFNELSGRGKL